MKTPPSSLTPAKLNDFNRLGTGPDPITAPEFYEAIAMKRIVAYAIDVVICFLLGAAAWFAAFVAGIMTFGVLLAPLMALTALVPLGYHVFMVGSPSSATLGMRLMGIRVFRLDGGRPSYPQVFVQIAVFYLTVPTTSFLILLICFFNPYRRCLHDYLAGTLTLNVVSKDIG